MRQEGSGMLQSSRIAGTLCTQIVLGEFLRNFRFRQNPIHVSLPHAVPAMAFSIVFVYVAFAKFVAEKE